MKDTTVNTELEQALYSGSTREQKLRQRATLVMLAPIVIGLSWLVYSGFQVGALQSRVNRLEDQAAAHDDQVAKLKAEVAQAESARAAAETHAASANQAQKVATEQLAALKTTLNS